MARLILPALLLLIVFPVLLLAGCGEGGSPREAQVEDFRLIREADGTQFVRGTLHNPSDRTISAVQLSVDLFENGGDQPVESMRVEVRDIAPGESKAFRQVVDSSIRLSGARVRNMLIL